MDIAELNEISKALKGWYINEASKIDYDKISKMSDKQRSTLYFNTHKHFADAKSKGVEPSDAAKHVHNEFSEWVKSNPGKLKTLKPGVERSLKYSHPDQHRELMKQKEDQARRNNLKRKFGAFRKAMKGLNESYDPVNESIKLKLMQLSNSHANGLISRSEFNKKRDYLKAEQKKKTEKFKAENAARRARRDQQNESYDPVNEISKSLARRYQKASNNDLNQTAKRLKSAIAQGKDKVASNEVQRGINRNKGFLRAQRRLEEAKREPNQTIEVENKYTGAKKRISVPPDSLFKALNHYRSHRSTKSARFVLNKK